MPKTRIGRKVLSKMKKQYGEEKGKNIFYASINKNVPGSDEWEGHSIMKKHMKKKHK